LTNLSHSRSLFFTTCYNLLSGNPSFRLNARFLQTVPERSPENNSEAEG
jgi:hypothetical protein